MDDELATMTISDDELAELALGADPHPIIDPRVAPWRPLTHTVAGLLPEWYMPLPAGTRRGTGAKIAEGVIIASFVLINALGLCVTYGWVTLA